MRVDRAKIEKATELLLEGLGYNWREDEGLRETPKRVARFYLEFTRNRKGFNWSTFRSPIFDNMVIVKDIPFFTLCEHHLLPFFGKISVGYMPKSEVIGVSKIVRVVQAECAKLQIQERLTQSVVDYLKHKGVKGAMAVAKGVHLCMAMRGVRVGLQTEMITSALTGCFTDQAIRMEFLSLIK